MGQSWWVSASRMRFMSHLLSLETFQLWNKSRSHPSLSIGFRLVYIPSAW